MMTEDALHAAVCKYIALQYPEVIFNTDLSGVRLHRGLQARVKKLRSSRAMPDLMIYETCALKGYSGLFIELKAHGEKLLLKDGVTLTTRKHIQEQAGMLRRLNKKGYFATFAVGWVEARAVIDWYIRGVGDPPVPNYLGLW